MIKHIVLWTLTEERPQEKARVAAEIKRTLEALNGKIEGLKELEVGPDIIGGEYHADVALYSEFVDEAALKGYIDHPLHVAAAKYVRGVSKTRMVADYKM